MKKPKPMTVRDLMAALQKMPPDKLVEIATEQDGADIYIGSVADAGGAVVLDCIEEP